MQTFFSTPKAVIVRCLGLLAISLALSACAHNGIRTINRQSNLATYLYSDRDSTYTAQQKKPLTLPIKVGVAFVPAENSYQDIPETTKKKIIDSVCSQLASHKKYVAGAFPIPSSYLRPKGGVGGLLPVVREFDVDVVVLLATSQSQRHKRNPVAALFDVTIIGQYLIPGNTVNTDTVLEAAVFHAPSRALIFRADGADETRSHSSRYGSDATAQNDSVVSIENASRKLVVSIAESLIKFEKFDASRAEEIPPMPMQANGATPPPREDYWRRVGEYKSSGGGSFDLVWLAIGGVALLCTARIRAKR